MKKIFLIVTVFAYMGIINNANAQKYGMGEITFGIEGNPKEREKNKKEYENEKKAKKENCEILLENLKDEWDEPLSLKGQLSLEFYREDCLGGKAEVKKLLGIK